MKKKLKYAVILMILTGLIAFMAGSFEGEEGEDVISRDAQRQLQLQDENGYIPPDGVSQGAEEKARMTILPEAWSEFPVSGPPVSAPDVVSPPPLPWVSVGPWNIGGRIRSIIVNPTDPSKIILGAVTGGIWKTEDGGKTWSTNTDFLVNINISSMVADPNDPNVIYAATGGETTRGDGILETTDGGDTWTQIESTKNNLDFRAVVRLAISHDGRILMAGTDTGLWRTEDRGATWLKVLNHPIYDVQFHPTDQTKCMSSGYSGNAFFSRDAGFSWRSVKYMDIAPEIPSGGIRMAYARSNPLFVYSQSPSRAGILYRSTDGGETFRTRYQCCTGGAFYTNTIWVDPTNENTIAFGGVFLSRSFDGGLTRMPIDSPHVDNQILVADPGYNATTNRTVYCGSDGGFYKTRDILQVRDPKPPFLGSHVEWTNLSHGLGVTQVYAVAANNIALVAGSQDNGSFRRIMNQPGTDWRGINSGDGSYCATDLTDNNYIYTSTQWLTILRSTDCGLSYAIISLGIPHECGGLTCTNFIAPFIIDPNDPNILLAGGNKLWKTDNAKTPNPNDISWFEIKPETDPVPSNVSAIAIAPGDSDTVWVGHNNGNVFYTTNGDNGGPGGLGGSPDWTQVTGLPQRYCTRIALGINGDVYATFGGFTTGNIWKKRNGTWLDVSMGLPRIPIYSVVVSPFNPNYVYIGTELGVFVSANAGQTWSPGNGGPASVMVSDLTWMGHKLVAGTFGRGVFTLGPTDE